MIPKKCFFTKGVGVHKEKLASFELALRSAGLAYCNLVLVSSIYPPGCKRICAPARSSFAFTIGKARTSPID